MTFVVGHPFLWFDFYDRNHFFLLMLAKEMAES